MDGIKLHGRAVPYNIPNSFQETVLPGSLDETLKMYRYLGYIPMWTDHRIQVGGWTEWEDREDGLYVTGMLLEPTFVLKYRTILDNRKSMNKLFSGIPGLSKFISGPTEQDKRLCDLSIGYAFRGPEGRRERTINAAKGEYKPATYTPQTGLMLEHVSLCNSGAYPGCHAFLVE